MARPTTKKDLLAASQTQYDTLMQIIAAMPEKALTSAFAFTENPKLKEAHWKRDKNVRDVLVHLYEWHRLLINWITANQQGEDKPFLPEPYNWRTYGEMNCAFWQKHQETPLMQAMEWLQQSHLELTALIETFTNDELFAKNQFTWTGNVTLGSYCVSATASHSGYPKKPYN